MEVLQGKAEKSGVSMELLVTLHATSVRNLRTSHGPHTDIRQYAFPCSFLFPFVPFLTDILRISSRISALPLYVFFVPCSLFPFSYFLCMYRCFTELSSGLAAINSGGAEAMAFNARAPREAAVVPDSSRPPWRRLCKRLRQAPAYAHYPRVYVRWADAPAG